MKTITARVALLIVVGFGTRALAQAPAGQVAELRKQLEEVSVKVAALSAESSTTSSTVAQLSAQLAQLEQAIDTLRREQKSIPDAVARLDQLSLRVDELRRDVEAIRTGLADQARGGQGGGADGARTEQGFTWATDDGLYSLSLGGYVQPQFSLVLPSDGETITESTFRLRRGRIIAQGAAVMPGLRYKLQADLTRDEILNDYWLDYQFSPNVAIEAGQDKLQLSRSFTVPAMLLDFIERAAAVDNLRYDRDIGVWAHGLLAGDRVAYRAGVSNGAGPNRLNDNIDFATMVRVDVGVLGGWIKPSFGDRDDSETPRLQIGGAAVHDLVRVPETLGGLEVANRDVDEDLVVDNVRMLSTELDLTFRYRGLEIYAEWMFRQERWGTILDHSDNAEIAAAVQPDGEGHRNYQAFVGQASYFVLPRRLQFGGRISHSRIPLLGATGASRDALPLTDRLFEVDGLIQFYGADGYRQFGIQYTMFNFNENDGEEPVGDVQHRVIAGAQVVF